ncbi:MAG: DNA cytosine methyltransferase, partial [Candidatus Thorarchaeota archaeon]
QDRPAYTINTHFNRPNVGCNIHYRNARLITVREAMRLQAFPDDFIVHSSNKRNYHVQVGNAVPPIVGQVVAARIRESIERGAESK